MEEVMMQITKYHRWSVWCFVGMIICMMITVVLYKKLKMKEVIRFLKRWKKRALIIVFLCCCITTGAAIPAEAAQIQENEEIQNPIAVELEVKPGSEELADAFLKEDKRYFVKNLEELPDLKLCIKVLDEAELFLSDNVLLEYCLNSSEEWNVIKVENIEWTSVAENQFTAEVLFDGTDHAAGIYEFRVSYENVVEEKAEYFLSESYVLDKVSPEFETALISELEEELIFSKDGKRLEPYCNPAKEIQWDFQIIEPYLSMEQTKVKVTTVDRNGKLLKEYPVQWEEQGFRMIFNEDGHYRLQVKLMDKSGNQTTYEKYFALDHTEPMDAKISYVLENGEFLSRVLHQLTFGYFAKEKITAQIKVEDLVSGVDKIVCTYEDVDTGELFTKSMEPMEDEENKNLYQTDIKLPYSFKGNLKVYSVDKMGNGSEERKEIGIIAESENQHLDSSKCDIVLTGKGKKYPQYYNEDVPVKFIVQDTYSGIQTITYTAGSELQETVSYAEENDIVTERIEKTYKIPAAANHANEILLGLEFTDNAGYTTLIDEEKLPVIHIDTRKPIIQISYDNDDVKNEKYYKEERTATVTVTEKNFDPEDIKFYIEGPKVEIGKWSHAGAADCAGNSDCFDTKHSDQCRWICTVRFFEDGEYRFGFSCTDLAGNTASYEKVDEFVVDQTQPIIDVIYDNYDVKNECYYKEPRIATISIKEKNFSAEDVKILLTADGQRQPIVSGWNSNGTTHQAVITYDFDGTFSFDVAYEDLAGNIAEDFVEEVFILDLTKPEIQISEIRDKSANQGVVSPLISVTDQNYLDKSTWYEMIGWYNGMLDVGENRVALENGEVIRVQDISPDKQMDDLYQLTVGAEDLAGNTAKETISFSVNRFGSVYTLDFATEQLAGEGGFYYTTQEIPLVITETNVDTLLFHEMICSLNGKLRTLQEGKDYKVGEAGDETSWKQYEYQIGADNFSAEGHYVLTVYSKDRAGNVSDNHSKGKTIAFAVDKTAPTILVSGIENNGRYKEHSRDLIINVADNLALAKAVVHLNENEYVFDEEMLQESKGKLSITIDGKNTWQTLWVEGKDMAGNKNVSEKVSFLVSENIWVQFYNHKELFWGSVAGFGGCILGIAAIVFYKRSRKQES